MLPQEKGKEGILAVKAQDLVSPELSVVLDAIVAGHWVGSGTVLPRAGRCVLLSSAILEHLTIFICIFIFFSAHKVGTESPYTRRHV